jgi:hypothetical protein
MFKLLEFQIAVALALKVESVIVFLNQNDLKLPRSFYFVFLLFTRDFLFFRFDNLSFSLFRRFCLDYLQLKSLNFVFQLEIFILQLIIFRFQHLYCRMCILDCLSHSLQHIVGVTIVRTHCGFRIFFQSSAKKKKK